MVTTFATPDVATTKQVYGKQHSMKELNSLSHKELSFTIKSKTGNAVCKTWIDTILWEHIGRYFQYIPTSHARFVRAKNIKGLKVILSRAGVKATFTQEQEANY